MHASLIHSSGHLPIARWQSFQNNINVRLIFLSRLLQIQPSDWLSYLLSIGDKPLIAKGIDFQIQNNGSK